MQSVLVLNASYEALCVVSTRRAVGLIVMDKAETVIATDGVLKSERMELPVPSVIRLKYYVKVPQLRRVALTKRAIFARDNYVCQYCGAPAENVDHVVPRSRGGAHAWDNVVAACRSCNSRKRDKLLSETNFVLRTQPRVPRGRAWSILLVGSVKEEWAPYLGLAELKVPSYAS